MGHIGIIAEYNPFHNGHAYQIEQIKKLYPDKQVIAVMSGDFVQRGEPAIYNKYVRSQAALSAGVDILFELSPLFAISSAELFATCAILTLSATGIVDTLCFGAEDDDLDGFLQVADVLLTEPDSYRLPLQNALRQGLSYPKARAFALSQHFENDRYTSILEKPNNILAIEYVKVLLKYKLPISPVIIKRTGASYHESALQTKLSSATAIRQFITSTGLDTVLSNHMPPSSYQAIRQHPEGFPLSAQHFYPMLQYALWEHAPEYSKYCDMNEDLANRLSATAITDSNYDDLIAALSSKNTTQSRIRHVLLNILLHYTKEECELRKRSGYVTYLRLLGFRDTASVVLKELKQNATLPIINKVAKYRKQLPAETQCMFERDLSISDLYHRVYNLTYQTAIPGEYQRTVIIHNTTNTI